jgi:hypothetical protein
MRTLRRTLLGSAVVALLLSATAVSVMAQDDEPLPTSDDFVFVTGVSTSVCGDGVCNVTDTMTDPRVSGDYVGTLDIDCSDETVCWMGGEISHEDGSWDGRWVGFINHDTATGRSHDIMAWYTGTGPNEGWSYIGFWTDFDRNGWDVRGVLYRGDLPPSVAPGLMAMAD